MGSAQKRSLQAQWSFKRFVRIGILRTDPEFIDPESVLFAESKDEWHFSDDPYRKQPVLERDNVGMGMLVLNNRTQGYLNLHGINRLYRKLRNLEVNTLKRFTALTSFNRDIFCKGLDLKDLLLFAESSQLVGQLQPLALEVLRNHYELSWLVHTYHKPLLVLMNGATFNSGAALCCLAGRSAAYKHSSFLCNAPRLGWIPDAGMSHMLSSLRGSLGIYLALTGEPLTGPDLIWSDLIHYWVSPEAFKHLELTSENQLEVSEHDAGNLIEEHYLKVPEEYKLKDWEAIIHMTFNKPTLLTVIAELEKLCHDQSSRVRDWAEDTLYRINLNSPLASQLTFALIRDLQDYRQSLLKQAKISPAEWTFINCEKRVSPNNNTQMSMSLIREALDERCLRKALKLELRGASRLVMCSDVVEGVRALLTEGSPSHCAPRWKHKKIADVPLTEIAGYFAPLSDKRLELNIRERSDMPLSAFPMMRKLHPDYDPETGLDHDPRFMAEEVERWSDEYLQEDQKDLRAMVLSYSA